MIQEAVITPLAQPPASDRPLRLASALNLRRDLYLFVDFVQREGLKRAHRTNGVPKGPALKLTKILSWAPESGWVQENGEGLYSDLISRLARSLGIVDFDVKGTYAGYSSTEASYPDNEIEVKTQRFREWLASDPLTKEREILDKLAETMDNEFFNASELFPYEDRFAGFGCATGPASRMKLPAIRKQLLAMLAELPANVWLPVTGLIEHVKATAPDLILAPRLCQRPLDEWEERARKRGNKSVQHLDERYQNFTEATGTEWPTRKETTLTEKTPDVFRRVEGRYLQYFLQQVPYLCGFVDLAMLTAEQPRKSRRRDRSNPDELSPPLDCVGAFRITPRLRQVVQGDPALQRVGLTVLPNFDVLVEAPSWPDAQLAALSPWCVRLKEDGPTHLLRLDRKKALTCLASQPSPPSLRSTLAQMSDKPLPANVATELDAWCGHAQKLTLYENVTLVEVRGELRGEVRAELGQLVIDDRPKGFLLASDGTRALSVLEQRQRVPQEVRHPAKRFGTCAGPLGSPLPKAEARPPQPALPARKRARISVQDMVAYRVQDADLLSAIQQALARSGRSCHLLADEGLLMFEVSELPHVRSALKHLETRFDVQLER